MGGVGAGVGEPFAAVSALKWFVPGMDPDMLLKYKSTLDFFFFIKIIPLRTSSYFFLFLINIVKIFLLYFDLRAIMKNKIKNSSIMIVNKLFLLMLSNNLKNCQFDKMNRKNSYLDCKLLHIAALWSY